ncbi:hypothetical protein J14TS2_40710 [Bacillus sp. J14TS2]|uniref:hypothetical protein n=1 Tax=Bacillus sp. J14TS2 TaxID=2807188 RepID=UPI001B2724B2|nr:hypothetical protein [Bacillus sp. J14TS2]GIN73596.1 hypothetical protein J14TS2_40710 [Bacillus sp. J14TS2]
MMEWMLAILLGLAVLLLILSFVKTRRNSSKVEREVDQLSLTMTDELYKLQQKVRFLEIDREIDAQELKIPSSSSKSRILLRDAIDLHRRGYSLENIAAQKGLSKQEMEQLLTPYMVVKEGEKSK